MSKPSISEVIRWCEQNLSNEPLDELGGYDPLTLIVFDLNTLNVLIEEDRKARAARAEAVSLPLRASGLDRN